MLLCQKWDSKCNRRVQSLDKGGTGIERVALKTCYTISDMDNYKLWSIFITSYIHKSLEMKVAVIITQFQKQYQ